MARHIEQIEFLVFREQDGRWQIVGEHVVQTMAEEHLRDLERAGYQAGIIRVRRRIPKEAATNEERPARTGRQQEHI